MRKLAHCMLWLALALPAGADERKFDFSRIPTNQPPTNCLNLVAGEGSPGDWRVLMDEVPLDPLPFATETNYAKKSIVAQLARDKTDEHYPLLVLGDGVYDDFTYSTRFKIVDGVDEQMAGIAFRVQDEKNFYVARASALGNTIYFYKFDKGLRDTTVHSVNVAISRGVWHQLGVKCERDRFTVMLDGQQAMPVINDTSFLAGKVGLWTKSDSVTYFADPKVIYTPREPFAQQLVRDTMKIYTRVIGIKVLVARGAEGETRMIASTDEKEIGEAGTKEDADVIKRGVNYYQKKNGEVWVSMPLTDRNGDPVASVRIVLKPLIGQTQQNALLRALPIIKTMQERTATMKNIVD